MTFFSIDYNLYGKVSYILPEFGVKILNSDFGSKVQVSLLVKSELYQSLSDKLVNITNGQIVMCKSDELFEDFA